MILALTQARLSSSRLPEKVLKLIGNETILGLHLDRLKKSKLINKIVLATTSEPGADKLLAIAQSKGVESFQGNLNDVLDRFYQAAKFNQAKIIVRLTSDCPLIDANLVDDLIMKFLKNEVDYSSNCLNPTFPDGFDAEVFTFSALEKAWKESTLQSDREHVTPYIWRNSNLRSANIFKAFSVENSENFSRYRLTIDNQADYDLVKILVEKLGPDADWQTYTNYLITHPELMNLNQHLKRNAGYDKSLNEDE